ncbi:DegV family protein [Microbulbifer celer]|uniref:DegV family protein n=1 Tax=Microbulbifer celer TaxID=435905 RepID=A0ABW3UC99_9GAMM|nr:DegV family protein [Microbulbifer celer]UFN55807.1 DegV family protein [Microbulbifer celer]
MVQLVVDSGCDLPDEILRKYAIPVLPLSVSLGNDTFGDQRNPAQMAHFYSLSLADRSHQISSGPASVEAIQDVVQKLLDQGADDIVIQTINGNNSPTHANARLVAQLLGSDSAKVHAVDSHTLFAGQGLLALYTLSLIQRGLTGEQIQSRAEEFGRKVVGYAAIKDVFYLRERGRQKNEKSVSWLKAAMARSLDLHPILSMDYQGSSVVDTVREYGNCSQRLFELATTAILEGKLQMPAVVVSIAGHVDQLEKVSGFETFIEVAKQNQVKVFRSVMSLSGGINLGPGTVSLAFATK